MTRRATILAFVLSLGVVLLARGGAGLAAPAALPPRPPIPTPLPPPATPTRVPTAAGAWIELRVAGAPAGAWSVVQWQNTLGTWEDVEGWQGLLENGAKRWWVAPRDFRKGPFRWVLLDGRNGSTLAISAPFTLPSSHYELRVVELAVRP